MDLNKRFIQRNCFGKVFVIFLWLYYSNIILKNRSKLRSVPDLNRNAAGKCSNKSAFYIYIVSNKLNLNIARAPCSYMVGVQASSFRVKHQRQARTAAASSRKNSLLLLYTALMCTHCANTFRKLPRALLLYCCYLSLFVWSVLMVMLSVQATAVAQHLAYYSRLFQNAMPRRAVWWLCAALFDHFSCDVSGEWYMHVRLMFSHFFLGWLRIG